MAEPIVVPIYHSEDEVFEAESTEDTKKSRAQPVAFAVTLEGKVLKRVYTRASAYAYVKQYRLEMAMAGLRARGWGSRSD